MVDIQSIPASLTLSATSSQQASTGLTAIQVVVTDVSESLQSLTRSIQTSATPTVAINNTLTLLTALGSVTVTLTQQTSAAERLSLLQQLMSIIQTQKPLTLSLQPGSPPTQGVLLIPTTSATPALNTATLAVSSLPLTSGQTFTAIVLPANTLISQQNDLIAQGQLETSTGVLEPSQQITIATTYATQISGLPQSLNITSTPSPYIQNLPLGNAVPLTSINVTEQTIASSNPTISNLIPGSSLPGIATPAVQTHLSIITPLSDQQAATVSMPSISASSLSVSQEPLSSSVAVANESLQSVVQTPSLAALLQPGNAVTLHVDTILSTQSNALSNSLPTLAPNQILATVGGTGTDGQLILKTSDAVLFVKTQTTAPVGTLVIVTIDDLKEMPFVTLPQPDTEQFQDLPQAMSILAQANPLVFQQIMATHIPQPTEALPTALLLLFSAFKEGTLKGWLGGDATDSLMRSGQTNLINNLSRELSNAGQTAQDAIVGEWKSYPIPLYAQQQFQSLTLYVHNDRDTPREQARDSSGITKVRFLIDMRLSKLGAMQIDGFVQPKKLDMVLRSEALLPEGMHNDLRLAYIKALGAVGYAGMLHFQVGRQHWMTMKNTVPQAIVT